MTLEQYIQKINAAYKRGKVLNAIAAISVAELKEAIGTDIAADKAGEEKGAPSLSVELVKQITKKFGLTFVCENRIGNLCFATNNDELRDEFVQNFSPIDVVDFLYAVLHARRHNIKGNDLVKRDFSKIPFPVRLSEFRMLIVLGRQLRQIHGLEDVEVETERLRKAIDTIALEEI